MNEIERKSAELQLGALELQLHYLKSLVKAGGPGDKPGHPFRGNQYSGGGGGSGGGGQPSSEKPKVNQIHQGAINDAASMAKVRVSHTGSRADANVDVHSFEVQGGSRDVDKLRQRMDRAGIGGMDTHQQSSGSFTWTSRSPLSTTGRHVRYEFRGSSPF